VIEREQSQVEYSTKIKLINCVVLFGPCKLRVVPSTRGVRPGPACVSFTWSRGTQDPKPQNREALAWFDAL